MLRLTLLLALLSHGTSGLAADQPLAETRVRELLAVWESGDVARLDELMSIEVVYSDVPNNRELKGLQAASDYIRHVHAWASQIDIRIERCSGTETDAVAEWTMTAVQSQPIPGRVPVATGRSITLRGLTLVRVSEGKIVRAADYLDALGFVLQLGSEVHLPGGVVLKADE